MKRDMEGDRDSGHPVCHLLPPNTTHIHTTTIGVDTAEATLEVLGAWVEGMESTGVLEARLGEGGTEIASIF